MSQPLQGCEKFIADDDDPGFQSKPWAEISQRFQRNVLEISERFQRYAFEIYSPLSDTRLLLDLFHKPESAAPLPYARDSTACG